MQLEFWVLERGSKLQPEWYRKERLPYQKTDGVKNILSGDRYSSPEEAKANAPDDSWQPRFVNWFSTCKLEKPIFS